MAIANIKPLSFVLPGVAMKFDARNAIRGLTGMPRNELLIGQINATGTATPGTVYTVTSQPEAIALCGHGSMLEGMYRFARRNAGEAMEINILPLADADNATAATGTISVSGSPTRAGVLATYIAFRRVAIAVTSVDDAAAIAQALADAINDDADQLVTAAAAGADVTLTAKWKGSTGNYIDVRWNYYSDEAFPAGVQVALTPMGDGALDPDIDDAILAMAGTRYTKVVNPYAGGAELAALEVEMETRDAPGKVMDGRLVTCLTGTVGELGTAHESRNSHEAVTTYSYGSPTPPWEIAAAMASVAEQQYALDPAVPCSYKPLLGVGIPAAAEQLNETARNMLLLDGCSTWSVEAGQVVIDRLVTNYTESPAGADDQSWRNLNWVETLSYWRWYNVNQFRLKYQQYKMAEFLPDPIPGQKIMTAQLGEEIMIGHYGEFCDAGLMQNMPYYKDTVRAEVDGVQGRLKIIEQPVLVTQHYQTEITSEFVAGSV